MLLSPSPALLAKAFAKVPPLRALWGLCASPLWVRAGALPKVPIQVLGGVLRGKPLAGRSSRGMALEKPFSLALGFLPAKPLFPSQRALRDSRYRCAHLLRVMALRKGLCEGGAGGMVPGHGAGAWCAHHVGEPKRHKRKAPDMIRGFSFERLAWQGDGQRLRDMAD